MYTHDGLEDVGAKYLNVLGCHPHFLLTEYRVGTVDNILHRLIGFDQDGKDNAPVLLLFPVSVFYCLVFHLFRESWGGIL